MMAYACRIEADSINESGDRLTTFVVTYPRFVHSELMTHRLLSRNSSSSRAIPTEKLIQQVVEDPAMPVWWGKNQSGMQARDELDYGSYQRAKRTWLDARDEAVISAKCLHATGLHNQCDQLCLTENRIEEALETARGNAAALSRRLDNLEEGLWKRIAALEEGWKPSDVVTLSRRLDVLEEGLWKRIAALEEGRKP